MKILTFIFILTLGIITLGFAQKVEKEKLSLKELKSFRPQLLDSLKGLRFGKLDTLNLDPEIDFIPNDIFLDREMYTRPNPYLEEKLPFYALPDPRSRMPIYRFDDSVNYTILKKEYR